MFYKNYIFYFLDFFEIFLNFLKFFNYLFYKSIKINYNNISFFTFTYEFTYFIIISPYKIFYINSI